MKYKTLLLTSLCLTLLFTASSFGVGAPIQRYIYKEQTQDQVNSVEIFFQQTDEGYNLKLYSGNEIWETISAPDYTAKKINLTYTNTSNSMSVYREDNYLVFNKTHNGETKLKSIEIDNSGWYGSIFMFKGFIISSKKKMLAYMAILNDQSAIQFITIKENIETIKINGKEVEVQKVKFTLPGWRSFFWASYYWFRASDGVLIKTKETRGPPGTPETIMELISETRG